MPAIRYPENPLITPQDVPPSHPNMKVIGAFNAGVARFRSETILVLRVAEQAVSDDETVGVPIYNTERQVVEVHRVKRSDPRFDFSDPRAVRRKDTLEPVWLTSMSHLRLARSRDGRHFTVDERPFLAPQTPYEAFGVEDPRVAEIDGAFYITYTAVSGYGIAVGLAVTRDFRDVRRLGLILPPENKDVVLFPERIGGRYYLLHRPAPKSMGDLDIWIASSLDLETWGRHQLLIGRRPGMWDGARVGGGAVPIRTDKGWLVLYHGADERNQYAMGACLLDLEDPSHVLARSQEPILKPETPYELNGFFGGVVFSCGAWVEGDVVHLYYGVSDEAMAGADLSLKELVDLAISEETMV
ncbi:glycoside hydrolase family 130 protein [Alicyclobacillus sendaiensis]|uniref:Glycoside hydrolase family 130 protein n=1 Tax=Alicyclobacillus sendaiensis PA2 TaxID=3029425 RepID=A0ABT6Y191_ALISE|nr:glycoside hydrolase family 130 protein [Alicyclobacillus sendaiensis]MDI9261091.1 glycoside hydrolase family 130 protein [Alicyclobacillus sendaiensis PA2]